MSTAVVPASGHAAAGDAHGHGHTNTGISHVKLAMWAFLSSECLFFGAFISTYLIYRGRDSRSLRSSGAISVSCASGSWPRSCSG
jgi:heme/copper-type cytochrome/quinol oxidase subunit 3